ncbi:hypothetical protein PILCRDRAFT_810276 [Piloderma croceum F 1598]|uniref:Uncharacterized protein n=1 Tax=Piloderma croceum (strain F 1598) TaxID=765440 RepID=A0A0C3CRF3_PILCF|nr:hypothetical protein PILCRDRAFT_810276 [Piloderma croceum F 1598]
MSNRPSKTHAVSRGTPVPSSYTCSECTHSRRAMISPGHRSSLSLGALVTPPISLPLDDASHASLQRTLPVHKSNTVHTSHPSSLPFPRTPSCSQIGPSLPFRSSPRRSMSDGSICPPALPSPPPSIHRECASTAAKEKAARVLVPPRRWDSLPLSVRTEPAAEASSLEDAPTSSPLDTEPPSPATMKKKQYSKLRRHLGASIPPELVYGDNGGVAISPFVTPVLEMVFEEERDWKTVPELHKEDDSSDESESEESWEDINAEMLKMRPPPPDSAKKCHEDKSYGRWMREKGGRRWLVSDYEDVIQALRDL